MPRFVAGERRTASRDATVWRAGRLDLERRIGFARLRFFSKARAYGVVELRFVLVGILQSDAE
eukprot:1783149-Lingulodinium_polyedra.AAC.1